MVCDMNSLRLLPPGWRRWQNRASQLTLTVILYDVMLFFLGKQRPGSCGRVASRRRQRGSDPSGRVQ
jgi:hypothetical protein